MKIYYYMILWVVLTYFFSLTSNRVAYTIKQGKMKVRIEMALFSMSFLVFFIGLRSSVGDTLAYIDMYNDLPTRLNADFFGKYTKDRGFFAISVIFKGIVSENYHVWLMAIAIICGIAIAKTLTDYSCNFYFSLFLFITMTHFVWMMNGMRQFIAVSIIFLNIGLMEKRKFISYVVLTLLLSTIHITALVMIPAYFIGTSTPWGKRFWLSIVAILIAGLSMDYIAERFSYVLEDSVYEGYLTAAATSAGSNFFRTVVAAAPPIFAYMCNKFIKIEDNRIINISVNFSVVSAVLYFCSAQSGGILIGRLPIYFDIYNLILLPWLVENCFETRSKKLVFVIIVASYLLFFYFKVKIGMNMGYTSDVLGIFLE